MSTVACIFARSGSKGVINKNIKFFNGKALITWAIEQALQVKKIDRVFVSTDSIEIAEISKAAGATIPFIRPAELATDHSPEWLSWQHFLKFIIDTEGMLPGTFLSLPSTSPMRSIIDIENCIAEFQKGNSDFVLGISRSEQSPYFNMVKKDENGNLNLVIDRGDRYSRRQDTPVVFDIAPVCYVGKPTEIMKKRSFFEGRVTGVEIPRERAIDIDTDLDFQIAEFLHKSKKPG